MTGLVRILVIDDEVSICNLLRDTLTDDGYEVETMPCGLGAAARVKAWKPAIVFIDILLPRMTGFDVLKAIRRVDGPTVVLMSAHQEMDDALTRFLRADGFISKSGEFVAAVEAAVAAVAGKPPAC